MPEGSSERRVALVTGANKGIGREIARRLLQQDYTVWVGCRDRRRGEAAIFGLNGVGKYARLLQIDVTDDDSVKAAAETLGQESGRLDVLVNNAGIATSYGQPPSLEPVELMKTIYETNVFGAVRVTQIFLPLLKASLTPRIVMMSSGLGSLANGLDPAHEVFERNLMAYSSSKTALNAITVAFAKELGPMGFKVNAADPGHTATDLNRNAGPRTVEQAAEVAIRLATLGDDGPNAGYFNDQGALPW
ncbi:MAG TPA: SDR family oxidoreductase [Stellaceae bacterium]|jgi:NAD(P)-dependent dehydrogenase (short-subunit alcohol dehydrogenase family)|nr:SDR family oxidoreductase [Stellaceae bacterium]